MAFDCNSLLISKGPKTGNGVNSLDNQDDEDDNDDDEDEDDDDNDEDDDEDGDEDDDGDDDDSDDSDFGPLATCGLQAISGNSQLFLLLLVNFSNQLLPPMPSILFLTIIYQSQDNSVTL